MGARILTNKNQQLHEGQDPMSLGYHRLPHRRLQQLVFSALLGFCLVKAGLPSP